MSQRVIPAQRRVRIQDHLAANRIVSATELSESLGVSEATIRRNLEEMERAGILERTHGGSDPESADEGMDGRASAELAARNVRVLVAGANAPVEKSAKTK